MAAKFSKAHILPMQQLLNMEKICTFDHKKINTAGNFQCVTYKHITKKKIEDEKILLYTGQKTFVTAQRVKTINTESESENLESKPKFFRVVGKELDGDNVEVHHLEGPLPCKFMQCGFSFGKTYLIYIPI